MRKLSYHSMLTHHRRLVSLSIVSTDLPVWSDVQAIATIYQRDQERFHLLLTEPKVAAGHKQGDQRPTQNQPPTPRLLWLEMAMASSVIVTTGSAAFMALAAIGFKAVRENKVASYSFAISPVS